MSTPFGLDFGNHSSVLAVARNRGIDIIVKLGLTVQLHPLSVLVLRTDSWVRQGKTKQTSNIKNTVDNIKRIVGMDWDDDDFENESKYFTSKLVRLDDGKIGAQVRLAGEQHVFSATQLAAMYIDKVKHTVVGETKSNITDVCIAVPVWYNEEERYAMADAARIAGLNPVRIVNDITAAGVTYGVFRTDLPEGEEKPRIVAFVDIGHSDYTCSIMSFKKGELKVLGLLVTNISVVGTLTVPSRNTSLMSLRLSTRSTLGPIQRPTTEF